MAHQNNQTQALVQEIQSALEANDLLRVRESMESLHPAEVADLFESLLPEVREELWVHIAQDAEGDVLSHSHAGVRTSLLEHMAPSEVAAATASLDTDDAADILQDLPEPVADEVLRSMDEQNRRRIAEVLTYPEDTAGGLMNVDAVTVRSDVDIDGVLRYLRLLPELPDNTDRLMIVDRENTYLGALPLADLVTADPDSAVSELMLTSGDVIPADRSANDVAKLFEKHDLISAPVVDENGRLLGRITVDDVVDVILGESERSIMSAAGLDEEHDIFGPIWSTARRRTLWLAVNLVTAFLAAWVIGLFEATIEQLVALAILMPVVASMGGIAGTQTLTIVIRGLALGHVGTANARALVSRELAVGFLNGVLWAVVIAVVAAAWFGNLKLGAVIGSAIVFNLLTAALAGTAIPLALKRMDIDPALAGGVVLTTITDVVGFFTFLGLASFYLV